jgi:hypothetical protein
MDAINKEQFWQDHISAWQYSGLPQAAYWRHRLSPAKEPASKLMKLSGMRVSSHVPVLQKIDAKHPLDVIGRRPAP